MSYANIYINQKSAKVPTILFLILVSFISLFLIKIFSAKPLPSRASKKKLRQLSVLNVSYNQVGVFWQTDNKEVSWLIYGEKDNKLDKVVIDEKDLHNKKNPYLNHYVLIRNLEQNRDYYFKIISDNQLISDSDSRPFFFRTSSDLPISTSISPAYGKVMNSNGTALASGVVILTLKNSYPLLSLLKLSGEWLIPLNNIVDKDTQKTRRLAKNESGQIEIYSEDGEKTSIEIIVENLSPLPQTVIIGKDYTFTSKEDVLAAYSKASNSLQKISIIFPKEEAVIPGDSPLIKGTALPGAEVFIMINSKINYSARVTAGSDGIWSVTPKQTLSAGQHSLTIITKDEQGKEVKLTRQFTIAKSGEQVLGDATPEPTLTRVPTPIPTVITTTPVSISQSPTPPRSGFDPLPLSIISGSLILAGLGILIKYQWI